MTIQTVTYETRQECLDDSYLTAASDFQFVLDHETEHFEKAVELGYTPVYGFQVYGTDFPPIITGFIDFKGKVPKGQDMIDILLAPKEPGKEDKLMAEEIRNELAGKK